MNEKQALVKSDNLWEWLHENFPADKNHYPEYEKEIEDDYNDCPCCVYYLELNNPYDGKGVYDNCDKCPLDNCQTDSDFYIWSEYIFDKSIGIFEIDESDAKQSALNISNKIKKRLEEIENEI